MNPRRQGGDFWSRRKAAVREAEAREEAQRVARQETDRAAELEEKSDPEILQELDLPDPDTLEAGDDFRPFLRTVVPERLRRRALRRLWALNPTLANLDGLVDYGDDFTDSATVVEGLQTAYQVGKGMFEHVKRMSDGADRGDGTSRPAEAVAEEQDDGDADDLPAQSASDTNAPAEDISPKGIDDSTLTETGDWPHTRSRENLSAEPDVGGEVEPIAPNAGATGPARKRMRFNYS
ncbi:MAG: DUF3306 domain-containing protein [Roseitalea sp.]|jgi:hypothetical protein|nr:DUF3306 domain-containing protein [Roseitalea sp.]MBO6741704.1 DUF3306 domain-containing protein [Roseitalea sp.]